MTEEIKNTEAPAPAESTEEKPAAQPKEYQRREGQSGPYRPRPRQQFRDRDDDGKEDRGGDHQHRYPKFKKKVCRFCYDKNLAIDYKDTNTLNRFITDRGKILPRRVTGTCAKHQRLIAVAIKRARIIALVPFIEK
ncbi:MAG TPA: 30S ribosomal protein S18 [Spirochaetota bacterium]|nr:30S ribosomal protein S18 [Spirochaetota bacterium]HRZ28244.1 30S ribosomal protein S18 [Spirochaetota bacterium]HSA13826.1 30S ribosomal protein S18 [Spirochaetota bacterium]